VLAGSIAKAQFTYTPLGLNSSTWTQDMVVEAGATNFANSITASMDGGTGKGGNTWFQMGLDTAAPTIGLPGGLFTSQSNSATEYLMQSFTANNAIFLNASTRTATMTLSTPTSVSGLSFLTADGNGQQAISVTINFADGTPSISGLSFNSPDWFNGTPVAYNSNGRVAAGTPFTFNNVNGNNPRLYEEDLVLPGSAIGHPISSINLLFGASSGNSVASIFALSASGQVPVGNIIWNGQDTNGTNGSWDTSSLNWQGSASFIGADSVLFDDTAAGTTNVTIQAGGVNPSAVVFNNSTKTYTLSGGGISAGSTLTLNGPGMVNLNTANTYTGATTVNAGTLNVGVGATLGSGPLVVNNTNVGDGTNVSVNFSCAETIGTLSGAISTPATGTNTAAINLNGNLTINQTSGTTYAGTLGGTGNLIYTGTANGILTLTGVNTYTGSTIINSGTLISAAPGDNQQGALPAGQPVTINSGAKLFFGTDDGAGYYSGSPSLITINGGTLQSAVGTHSTLPALVLNSGTITSLGAGNVSNGATTNFILDGGVTTVASSTPSTISAPTILLRGDPFQSGVTGPVTFTIPRGTAATDLVISSSIVGKDSGAGLTKNGNGILQLSGNNTYTGPTNINGGQVVVSTSAPFGSGLVTLAGGTVLTLSSVPSINGFGQFSANGGATFGGGNGFTVLTDNGANEARSVFAPKPVTIGSGFTANFTYTASGNRGADGFTFVIQNSPTGAAAVGAAGGSLGYAGITNSEALEFNIYTGGGQPIGTALGTNTIPVPTSSAPVNLAGGDSVSINVVYDNVANTLTENLLDLTTGATYTNTFTGVNLPAALGGNTGYVGFTGSTGGNIAYQTVSNFTFNNYSQGTTMGSNLSIPDGNSVRFDVAPASAGGAGNANLTGTVTLGSGSTWNITGGPAITNTTYSIGGTATVVLGGNATVNVANNGTGSGSVTLGSVNDNSSGFSLTKSGNGSLSITGASTYSGGTTINSGTVAISHSAALGTGDVTMNGGVLSFASGGPTITGFTGFISNGAGLDGTNSAATLTDNGGGEAHSIFSSSAVSIANGFTASFVYTASGNRAADGMAFVIQNSASGASALGGTGGGLGYGGQPTGTTTGGIPNSVALEFNLYTNGGQPIGTGLNVNGLTGNYISSGPVNLASGDPIAVYLTYNSITQALTEILTDQTTLASYSTVFTGVNIFDPTILNGTAGYIGFTGGDGGLTSTQTVSNFAFNNFTTSIIVANNISLATGSTSGLDVAPITAGGTGAAMVTGNLTLGAGSTLNITGGLTSNGSLAATGNPYLLTVSGTTTLAGNVTISVANNGLNGTGTVLLNDVGESVSLSSLTKTGNGTLLIQGAATYTGPTNITGGTLGIAVSGSLSGTKQINIASGATFDVSAPAIPYVLHSGVSLNNLGPLGLPSTVNGDIDAQSGATVSAGTSGQLTISGNAMFEAGSTLKLSLSKSGFHAGSQPDLTDYGQLTIGLAGNVSGSTLSLTAGSGLQAGDIFTIILTSGTAVTGKFAGLGADLATFSAGGDQFEINYHYNIGGSFTDTTGTNVAIMVVAVPEPGSLAALLGGLGVLTGLQRLRRMRK